MREMCIRLIDDSSERERTNNSKTHICQYSREKEGDRIIEGKKINYNREDEIDRALYAKQTAVEDQYQNPQTLTYLPTA